MAKRKKEPEIRLPKIKQLPSGAWHTRVLIEDRRVSITKDTYDECVAEYLALKNGVIEAKAAPGKRGKTLGDTLDKYIARMHLRQRLSSSWALISFIMHPPSMKP